MGMGVFDLSELSAARDSLRRRLLFPKPVEQEYRRWQERRFRIPRMVLFALPAAAYLFAPLYNELVFQPVPEVVRLLHAVQLGWAVPVFALAIWVTAIGADERLSFHVHTLAVLTLWATVLTHMLLGILGYIQYPGAILGISVFAVAALGGFRARRQLVGGTTTLLVGLAAVWFVQGPSLAAYHATFETVFFWVTAMGAAVSLDVLARNAWINQQQAEAHGRVDALTGVLTRSGFDALYPRVVAMAARERKSLAVCLVDLDHFKGINDRYGHLVGDDILRRAGRVIEASGARRPLDLCARYGGEEFILVWYDIDDAGLPQRVQAVLAGIRRIVLPVHPDNGARKLTASAGAACAVLGPGDSGLSLVARADRLLYVAKNAGRDRSVLESDVIDELAERRGRPPA